MGILGIMTAAYVKFVPQAAGSKDKHDKHKEKQTWSTVCCGITIFGQLYLPWFDLLLYIVSDNVTTHSRPII